MWLFDECIITAEQKAANGFAGAPENKLLA